MSVKEVVELNKEEKEAVESTYGLLVAICNRFEIDCDSCPLHKEGVNEDNCLLISFEWILDGIRQREDWKMPVEEHQNS